MKSYDNTIKYYELLAKYKKVSTSGEVAVY